MQLIELVVTLAGGGAPRLSPSWSAAGWATAVGILLGQALGIAPSEESFFRGFLLPQVRLKFSRMKARTAVAAAIVLSQLIFALYHVPNLVLGISGKVGTTASDVVAQLVLDFVIGVVFAGLYLRTGNLLLVIGIHALQNAGTTVIAPDHRPASADLHPRGDRPHGQFRAADRSPPSRYRHQAISRAGSDRHAGQRDGRLMAARHCGDAALDVWAVRVP